MHRNNIIAAIIMIISIIIAAITYDGIIVFDNNHLLYKFNYTEIIDETGSKEYYVREEDVLKYPEFKNIIMEAKKINNENYFPEDVIIGAVKSIKNLDSLTAYEDANTKQLLIARNTRVKEIVLYIPYIGILLPWLLLILIIKENTKRY